MCPWLCRRQGTSDGGGGQWCYLHGQRELPPMAITTITGASPKNVSRGTVLISGAKRYHWHWANCELHVIRPSMEHIITQWGAIFMTVCFLLPSPGQTLDPDQSCRVVLSFFREVSYSFPYPSLLIPSPYIVASLLLLVDCGWGRQQVLESHYWAWWPCPTASQSHPGTLGEHVWNYTTH